MYSTLSRCLRLTRSGRWTTYWQRRISATYRLVFTRRSTRIPSRTFGSGSTHKWKGMVERRWSHGKRSLLCRSWAEGVEDANRTGGQALWKPLIRGRSAGNSAGQKQTALLVGTSRSHTRRDAAAVGDGRTTSSRV